MVYNQGLEFGSLIDISENSTMSYMTMNWIELTHRHNLFLSHQKNDNFLCYRNSNAYNLQRFYEKLSFRLPEHDRSLFKRL